MTKQMMPVEVPDGQEAIIHQYSQDGCFLDVRFELRKKEPKFIEVRDYITKDAQGLFWVAAIANSPGYPTVEEIESLLDFVKWSDPGWRKVYV